MMNVINGGKHAGNELSIQEFLILPSGFDRFSEKLRAGVETYHELKKVMGSVPKPHLGIASGILVTMRNVGMVLGIATGGAVLYAFAPSYILQKANLKAAEAAVFLSGLKYH
jgi:hypothetical protein